MAHPQCLALKGCLLVDMGGVLRFWWGTAQERPLFGEGGRVGPPWDGGGRKSGLQTCWSPPSEHWGRP